MVAVYQEASGWDSTGKEAVASINQLTRSTLDRRAAVQFAFATAFDRTEIAPCSDGKAHAFISRVRMRIDDRPCEVLTKISREG
jgi:hypothetical protein